MEILPVRGGLIRTVRQTDMTKLKSTFCDICTYLKV